MTKDEHDNLKKLSTILRREQSRLLIAASSTHASPSQSTLRRVAELELNIAAIENTLADAG